MILLRDFDDVVSTRPDPAVTVLVLTYPGDHVALSLVVLVEPFTLKLGPNLPLARLEEMNDS